MSTVGQNLTSEVKSRAGVGIVMGILTAALGVLMIIYPLATAKVTTLFIGAALIVVGVLELVQAVRSHTIGRFFLRLLLGIVYGFAGVLLLANPLWGVAVLTSVLAGATVALVAALASSHSLAASIIAGVIVAIVAVVALMEYQLSVWLRYAVESEDASDAAAE